MYSLQNFSFCILFLLLSSSLGARSYFDWVRDLFSVNLNSGIFKFVNKRIKGGISATKIKFILPNRFEFEDLEIIDQNGERVLYAKHIKLALSLPSFFTNNYVISEAFVDSPFFRYVTKNNIHNVIDIFQSPEVKIENSQELPSKTRVTIASASVVNGSYEMDHDAGVEIFAQGIEAQGTFWISDGPFGVNVSSATIYRGAIAVGNLELPLSHVHTKELFISDERVSTGYLTAFYEKAELSGRGAVYIDEERYDIQAEISAPENTYPQGLKRPFIGNIPAFRAVVGLTGPLDVPEISSEIDFDRTVFQDVEVKKGKVFAHINPSNISINSGDIYLGSEATVHTMGGVNLENGTFKFKNNIINLSVLELGKFAGFTQEVQGVLNTQLTLSGNMYDSPDSLNIAAMGNIEKGQFSEFKLVDKTNFDIDLTYEIDDNLNLKKLYLWREKKINLSLFGFSSLAEKKYKFNFDFFGENLNYIWPQSKKIALIKKFGAMGVVAGDGDDFEAQGILSVGKLQKNNLDFRHTKSQFLLTRSLLQLNNLNSNLFSGQLQGDILVQDLYDKKNLSGNLKISNIDCNSLATSYGKKYFSGSLDASLGLGGNLDNVEANYSLLVRDLIIREIELGRGEVVGYLHPEKLVLEKIDMQGGALEISGNTLVINRRNKQIAGDLLLSMGDMEQLSRPFVYGFSGRMSGMVHLSGAFSQPIIKAALNANQIIFLGQSLGRGAIKINLQRELLFESQKTKDLVFSLAANLKEQDSLSDIRFAYAFEHETIHSDIKISQGNLDTRLLPRKYSQKFIGAKFSYEANISARGSLLKPSISVRIRAPEVNFIDPASNIGSENTSINYGPLEIQGKLSDGVLDLNGCLLLGSLSGKQKCYGEEGGQFSLSGEFLWDSYKLNFDADWNSKNVEKFIWPLKNELVSLSIGARLEGALSKKTQKSIQYDTNLYIDNMMASLPSIPAIELENPVTVKINNNGIKFLHAGLFNFYPGQLEVSGGYDQDLLGLSLRGTIPLVFSRFFLPLVQRAEGLASGELFLSGSFAKPIFEGMVVPQIGSIMNFSQFFETVEIRKGALSFVKNSDDEFVTYFDNIRLGVGEGLLAVDGGVVTNYSDPNKINSSININAEGSNIIFRDRGDFVETDFFINTKQIADGELVASGRIVIIDGGIYRQFDLRNFVARSESAYKSSTFSFLKSIQTKINIAIQVRQFNAAARMLNLDIETILSGQFIATGLVSQPRFVGNLNVDEGSIVFPSTTFDMIESRVEFKEDSLRAFNPEITIKATQELEKEVYAQAINQDTLVELTLNGTSERLNLGLRPVSGDLRLSQTRIFLLLLLPRSFSGQDTGEDQIATIKSGAKRAAMALSGEVFLRPLTNELQDILEAKTNTRIQFGSSLAPGGATIKFNWKMGPRVELQGSYLFLTDEPRTLDQGKSQLAFDDFYPLGALKLKLLLFDHRPFGPLFFETGFGANWNRDQDVSDPFGSFGLKYRAVSK